MLLLVNNFQLFTKLSKPVKSEANTRWTPTLIGQSNKKQMITMKLVRAQSWGLDSAETLSSYSKLTPVSLLHTQNKLQNTHLAPGWCNNSSNRQPRICLSEQLRPVLQGTLSCIEHCDHLQIHCTSRINSVKYPLIVKINSYRQTSSSSIPLH